MEIPLIAFAADCIVRGVIDLGADRLADHLNADESVEIRNAVLESLDDGHEVAMALLEVQIADLFAVVAAGPRGTPGRRVRDRSDLVNLRVGPYTIVGDLHSAPGAGPLMVHRRRGAFLALTEARFLGPERAAAGAEWPKTLLVNWSQIAQVLGAGGEVAGIDQLPDVQGADRRGAREIFG